MVDRFVYFKVVVGRQAYIESDESSDARIADSMTLESLHSPLIASLSCTSCKMSSGTWLATRRMGALDDGAFAEEPTNRFLGFRVFAGFSIPSTASIVSLTSYVWLDCS